MSSSALAFAAPCADMSSAGQDSISSWNRFNIVSAFESSSDSAAFAREPSHFSRIRRILFSLRVNWPFSFDILLIMAFAAAATADGSLADPAPTDFSPAMVFYRLLENRLMSKVKVY